jgi:hypothetical protein
LNAMVPPPMTTKRKLAVISKDVSSVGMGRAQSLNEMVWLQDHSIHLMEWQDERVSHSGCTSDTQGHKIFYYIA